jgi:formaldehyde-activating enzyme
LEKLGKVPMKGTAFEYPAGPLAGRFGDLELSADDVDEHELRVGSGTAGAGVKRVQIDLIAGSKDSPLGDAYALQMTYPLHRREALTTILEPALTVRPSTLLLPALPQRNLRQANMIYGPAQSALGRAVVDALEIGRIPAAAIDRDVMVALVTIHPRATDRLAVAKSVRAAAESAIQEAFVATGRQAS